MLDNITVWVITVKSVFLDISGQKKNAFSIFHLNKNGISFLNTKIFIENITGPYTAETTGSLSVLRFKYKVDVEVL